MERDDNKEHGNKNMNYIEGIANGFCCFLVVGKTRITSLL